jgi:hypothetical protein
MSAAPGFFSNPIKSTPGMTQYDISNAITQSMPSAGAIGGNNNIGQVYQDMGQNYQQFGQAYQQATQAADQLKDSYAVNQQQMNQYLTALQGALGGMNTANMNTGGTNPGFGTPLGAANQLSNMGQQGLGSTGQQALQAGQQGLINAQTQFMTGTIAPAYQQAVAGATGLYGAPSMTPQDFYNQYSNVIFGQPGSAYTPNFQG